MTRTYIIAADGTRFVAQGEGKRFAIKVSKITTLFLLAIFATACLVGVVKGAGGDYDAKAPHTSPVASATSQGVSFKAMQKACTKAAKKSKNDCYALYLRRDWHNSFSYTPAGPALVKECISQYRGRELADCFTQEF